MNHDASIANPDPRGPKLMGRPLEGLAVGISVALGEDSNRHGFGEEEMNRAVVRLSDALLSTGARLVFGHDWRPTGIMSAVARLAVSYDPGAIVPEDQTARRSCRITNLVPSDRSPELPPDLREDLEQRGMLRIEVVSSPASFAQRGEEVGNRALRAAALSVLRRRLADLCDARICLGGKFQKYEGFWPGILEEAFISAAGNQGNKVLLSGMLGGASAKILQAARSGNWADLLSVNPELREGFNQLNDLDTARFPDLRRVPEVLSWNRLQQHSGLGEDDWNRLAEAKDIEVVSALSIKALRPTRSG